MRFCAIIHKIQYISEIYLQVSKILKVSKKAKVKKEIEKTILLQYKVRTRENLQKKRKQARKEGGEPSDEMMGILKGPFVAL